MNQGILAILVSNHFGVLTKVTGLFARRGFNIKALSVGETEDPAVSRITILAKGDDLQLEQIYRQVCKLEDVHTAKILSSEVVERELALIKVRPDQVDLGDLMQLVTDFSAKTASAPEGCAIIEATGTTSVIDDLVAKAGRFHIVEMSRTGITALERSDTGLSAEQN